MSNKLKKIIKELLKYSIIFILVLNIVSYFKSQDLNNSSLDLNSFSLIDGSIYEAKSNKPLMIHFWATWCPICALEEQNIEKISKDFEVITIASQSGSNEEIKDYLEKNNLSFKVVNDEDGDLSNHFKVNAFPTTFIYEEKKNLKFSEVGYTSTFGLYLRMLWSK